MAYSCATLHVKYQAGASVVIGDELQKIRSALAENSASSYLNNDLEDYLVYCRNEGMYYGEEEVYNTIKVAMENPRFYPEIDTWIDIFNSVNVMPNCDPQLGWEFLKYCLNHKNVSGDMIYFMVKKCTLSSELQLMVINHPHTDVDGMSELSYQVDLDPDLYLVLAASDRLDEGDSKHLMARWVRECSKLAQVL
jgi:hypothetical protein